MFRLAAGQVTGGEVEGKEEAASWVARRLNVIVGEEWDKPLETCAEYLEAAGDSPEEIAKALNEIADAIYPNKGTVNRIAEPAEPVKAEEPAQEEQEEKAAVVPEPKPEPATKPKPEQKAAEPSNGTGGINSACQNGNCYSYPGQGWGWWW